MLAIERGRVTVATSQGLTVTMRTDDPMLSRLDLAYALNAHMAQGLTSDRGIAVMETRDAKLVNQQTFLVTVTRLRDSLTLIVDNADKLQTKLIRNPGGKTSALETGGGLRDARGRGEPKKGSSPPEKSLDLEPEGSKPYDIGI